MKRVLFFIFIFFLLIILYGIYIEPYNLKVNEYVINTDKIPNSFTELKVVHFSDLLYSQDEKKLNELEDTINNLNADIIIFSGDLFSKDFDYKEKDFNALKKFLSNLDSSLYKYAVIGDSDQKHINEYKDILYDSNFILLDNTNQLFFYKDINPINIIGLTNTNNIEELLKPEIDCNYNIVITHKPDTISKLEDYNIDLVLSGHSLGGIINIPFYGRIISKKGAKTYLDNYYKVNNTDLYVSNGIGYEKVNFRLFNTPSINVYRWTSK